MEYSHIKKRIDWLVCICIVATLFLSAGFVISHADHDCIGHDCPICLQIYRCVNILQQLSIAGLGAVAVGLVLAIGIFCSLLVTQRFDNYQNTLVALKVRLND